MMQAAGALLLLAALLTGATGPGIVVPAGARHSGAVVFIDVERRALIVDEVRPSRIEHGRTVTTRLTIDLRPDTKVNTFIRVSAPGRFAGNFIEVALDAADVTPGDIVTIDCRHEGGRLVAVTVTLAALD